MNGNPSFENLSRADFLDPPTMFRLFDEAVRRGWVHDDDPDRVRFFAAGSWAASVLPDAARAFERVVRARDWSPLCDEHFDVARARMR